MYKIVSRLIFLFWQSGKSHTIGEYQRLLHPASTDMIPSATPDDLVASGTDYDWDERNPDAQSCLDGMAGLLGFHAKVLGLLQES